MTTASLPTDEVCKYFQQSWALSSFLGGLLAADDSASGLVTMQSLSPKGLGK
ncbi:hypothetical protein ABIB45_001720 [Arthrobacter sp. UYCo732]